LIGKVNKQSGLLSGVRQSSSPNYNDRPLDTAIDCVVIHCIALPPRTYGGTFIEDFFTNQLDYDAHPSFADLRDLRVSAHLVIARTGTVTQYVPFDKRAWHAGVSCWQGRDNVNDYSVGIELEGCVEEPYLPAQYASLLAVIDALMGAYPQISLSRLVGHDMIAPQRKTDPGAHFNWQAVREQLQRIRTQHNG